MENPPTVIVTGYSSPYEQRLRELADARGVRLRMPSYLDKAGLDGLYALASCVVVASFYEGFGLPVLEAMARGVPVVGLEPRLACRRWRATPLCWSTPTTPPTSAGASRRRWPIRSRCARAGLRRAAGFTWERTASLTAETYRRALASA